MLLTYLFKYFTSEREGFEPSDDSSPPAVFKTAAFNRSATSPDTRELGIHSVLPLIAAPSADL